MSAANSKPAKYDISQLEAALEAETRMRLEAEDRLRRTNEELQEFILNAAHDLREPLRTVNAYCELLTRKDNECTDSEADQFRRYILDGTGRIQTLIAGMVEYATAESDSRYLLRIDMNEVLREALAYSLSDPRQRAAVVTRDSLPYVSGDFEKLVKVFRHLLDNAARYCEAEEPQAHVSSRLDGAEWLFVVKDNGPGIDAAYHKRIFAPFKRLHGRHHAGTGLGLTVCQKVIESHGGRMWVESEPGEGSRFCFTLPAAD
jgi:light-regulated signal transduction histidine kinase (bacteriophytochrome)